MWNLIFFSLYSEIKCSEASKVHQSPVTAPSAKSALHNSSSEDRSPERSVARASLKGDILLNSSSEDRSPERSPPKGILKSPPDASSRTLATASLQKAGEVFIAINQCCGSMTFWGWILASMPRTNGSGSWIRILLYSSLTFKMSAKN